MSDEEALLAAIYANHDEDTPRLVYADWLDEHGQHERAEFIRVQVELSHLTDEDPRERPLRDRRWELWEAHREQWTAEVGIVENENVKVDFRRGFIDEVNLYNDLVVGIDAICRVPGVRQVSLNRVSLTPDAIRELAALDLDSLSIHYTQFPGEWLELLESLPCGTVLNITPNDEAFASDIWHEFQSRRIGRLAQLPAAERYAEARRWQRGHDEPHGYTRGIKTVCIQNVRACDAELQLLAELKHVEEVSIARCDLTLHGLGLVATLPHLKRLRLWSGGFETITPLASCTTLEELRVWPNYGMTVGDAGTEGLDQLVNLRELLLRPEYGECTLARLGSLRKLRSLDIEVRSGLSADSFAGMSNLTELETLKVEGDVPGKAIRFLAPCCKLQTIEIHVPTGTPDDFAALGALTNLRELHIKGDAVTDEAIHHLSPLKKLRTLMAQDTEITLVGARWLADQLPEVTVILDEYVAKSQRTAMTFCRHLAERGECASALLPSHWTMSRGRTTAEPAPALIEDGWGDSSGYGAGGVVGPAIIRLYARDETNPSALMNTIARCSDPSTQEQSSIEELNVVELAGKGVSCVYSFYRSRELVAVIGRYGKCAILDCDAPQSRFEEFRSLFYFVARSLRVGEDAKRGIGEEITVAVSEM